jgi:hypothetical protein
VAPAIVGPPAYRRATLYEPIISGVPARIATVIASDPRFAYFGNPAFGVRLLRHRRRRCFENSAIDFRSDKTQTLFLDGQAVEVPVFFERQRNP